jgi:hypothetical protein
MTRNRHENRNFNCRNMYANGDQPEQAREMMH